MDHTNIHLYKDGDDLIVVFKGADKTLEDLITSMLGNSTPKKIPSLEDPDTEVIEKPNVKELPEFLTQTDEPAKETFKINNFVDYMCLFVKIKLKEVNDIETATKLCEQYKKDHPAEFGEKCCSTLTKVEMMAAITEYNKFNPALVKKKAGDLSELAKKSENDIRYAMKGIVWYGMKL